MSTARTRRALALAIAIEHHNAHRFKEWANRFRTYDLNTSEFLVELADEEVEHKQELVSWFHRLFNEPPPDFTYPRELHEYVAGLDSLQEHFFVADSRMARSILEYALAIERYTRNFYSSLLEQTDDPELQQFYRRLSDFEADHEQKFLDQIKAEKNRPNVATL